jgi:hypothetical protein
VIVTLLLANHLFVFSSLAQEFRLKFGKTANGFHIPQKWQGKTIIVVSPENEHVVYAIEDMFAAAGLENDVFVGQTKGINNAFAVIDGKGNDARRFIVIDPEWSYRFSSYRVILAHELGHHVCRHTLDRYNTANRRDMELEADRAAGAILRKSYGDGMGSVGGDIIDLKTIVETVGALGPGSSTHPPAKLRVNAYVDGWNNGSSCLESGYAAINPWPAPDPAIAARIERRYGTNLEWCYFGAELIQIGPCQPRHPRVLTEIKGHQLRITLLKANRVKVRGVHPPDLRSAPKHLLLFEGTADDQKVKGRFWYHLPGCAPVSYDGEGNFVENNGLFLAGALPKMVGCKVVGSHAPTLHFFKNMCDILMKC